MASDRSLTLPRKQRSSWPAHWLKAFGWRQIVVWTPKVGTHAVMTTVRIIPRHGGCFIGLYVGKDEDGEWNVRAGIGLAEVEMTDVRFYRYPERAGSETSRGDA